MGKLYELRLRRKDGTGHDHFILESEVEKRVSDAYKRGLEEAAQVAARQVGDWYYATPGARAWHAENVAAAIRAKIKERDDG